MTDVLKKVQHIAVVILTNTALHVVLLSMASTTGKPSDKCRVFETDFKIKYGIPNGKREYQQSTENLFRPRQRKECFSQVILAKICRSVSITVDGSKAISDRICCSPCARNLGNLVVV